MFGLHWLTFESFYKNISDMWSFFYTWVLSRPPVCRIFWIELLYAVLFALIVFGGGYLGQYLGSWLFDGSEVACGVVDANYRRRTTIWIYVWLVWLVLLVGMRVYCIKKCNAIEEQIKMKTDKCILYNVPVYFVYDNQDGYIVDNIMASGITANVFLSNKDIRAIRYEDSCLLLCVLPASSVHDKESTYNFITNNNNGSCNTFLLDMSSVGKIRESGVLYHQIYRLELAKYTFENNLKDIIPVSVP